MAKVLQMDFPPGYQELLEKILSWFDSQIYPTWATLYFHRTRSAKKRNREKTIIPSVKQAWINLTSAEKTAWKNARGYTKMSGYNVFMADYAYRQKNGLSLPGTPYTSHQLYGLKMSNPGASENVQFRLHLKDLIGPITVEFYYKKTEYSPTGGDPFNVNLKAFYFDGGLNILDENTWQAPSGNVDWTKATTTVGNTGRRYFHLIIQFSILNYDADIYIDNFKVQDNTGIVYSDSFHHSSIEDWSYEAFYRKRGWAFYPSFDLPYYDIVYLDS